MAIIRSASAHWQGSIKEGKGTISSSSGALSEQPFGFNTRFEDQPGTNPEELIGAAHAGCFSMALSKTLGDAGYTAESIDTNADVSLIQDDNGFTISKVALSLKASIPGISDDEFQQLAATTKAACPVSRVLNAEITLTAELV